MSALLGCGPDEAPDPSESDAAARQVGGPLDRRTFLGAAGAAAGALAALAVAPLPARTLVLLREAQRADSAEAGMRTAEPAASPHEDDWHIDDMWGHMPRYAHPIPHSPIRTSPIAWERVDPIDRGLVV